MPYYLHAKGSHVPDEHETTVYASRADAYAALARTENGEKTLQVTFSISDDERRNWRLREHQRFMDGVYASVPWASYPTCWEPLDRTDQDYGRHTPYAHHFAHLSLKDAGQIAYTPSEEHGVQDRQVKITTARYLLRYCKPYDPAYWTAERIASYTDSIKALNAPLQIATSTKDIVSIYRNGPSSCMDKAHEDDGDFRTGGIHPCSVYGKSDLAVAYLGTVAKPTARCVVWPEKTRYTRIYGDSTLEVVLKTNGYTQQGVGSYGSLDGARVRLIECENGIVLPYIDAAGSASPSKDRKWVILHDGYSGTYETDCTNGLARHERYECSNCSGERDEDEIYCEDCENDRYLCARCNENVFGLDNIVSVGDSYYCEYCANQIATTCENCGDHFHEKNIRSRDQVESGDPLQEYCGDCRRHYTPCAGDCGDLIDTRDRTDYCEDCQPEDEENDTPITATDDQETGDSFAAPTSPCIESTLSINLANGTATTVEILHLVGALAVHETYFSADYPRNAQVKYTVSHVLTGLAAEYTDTLERAISQARLYAAPGIDWSFTHSDEAPADTIDYARRVRRGLITEEVPLCR